MMQRARRFVRRNLLPNHILCYHVNVFHEYAMKLISPIEILADMDEVQHEIDESHIKQDKCRCHRLQVGRHVLRIDRTIFSVVIYIFL
jgi:hypothetical protein